MFFFQRFSCFCSSGRSPHCHYVTGQPWGHGANEGRGHGTNQRPLSGGALVKGKRQSNSALVTVFYQLAVGWCSPVLKREIDDKLLLRSSKIQSLKVFVGKVYTSRVWQSSNYSVVPKRYEKLSVYENVLFCHASQGCSCDAWQTIELLLMEKIPCTSWCRNQHLPVFMLAQSSPRLNVFFTLRHKAAAHCSRINL